MTTRDEEAEKALKLFQLAVEDHNDNPYIVKVAHVEAAYQAVLALICPPAPAAITEAQIEAAAKAIYERQSWETRNHWDDLDDIERDEWIADAQVALAAAPAQSGGERNKE